MPQFACRIRTAFRCCFRQAVLVQSGMPPTGVCCKRGGARFRDLTSADSASLAASSPRASATASSCAAAACWAAAPCWVAASRASHWARASLYALLSHCRASRCSCSLRRQRPAQLSGAASGARATTESRKFHGKRLACGASRRRLHAARTALHSDQAWVELLLNAASSTARTCAR